MAKPKKQDITIGNGATKAPILASDIGHTEAKSKPSQTSTSIESGSTKPVSLPEAMSLLQTLCLDMRGLGCKTILAGSGNRLYIAIETPASIGQIGFEQGHITIDSKPVVTL